MARLPETVAPLFAPVITAVHDSRNLELTTQFIAGYSLGELVFQRRISAHGLAAVLERVYRAISSRMWVLPPLALEVSVDSECYVGRIRRRLSAVDSSEGVPSGSLRRLLRADCVTVNGRSCVGVSELLAALDTEARWQPIVKPGARTLCHGDLILEDIIVDGRSPAGFRLVDPNPSNQSPLYDVSKTLMSLLLGYEFLYFDRFSLETLAEPSGEVEIVIRLEDPEIQALYATAAEHFTNFVITDLAGHLQLPGDEIHSLLRMAAAVNMLAIPMFHLLHHRNENRALAFAATALWHAQEARAGGSKASREVG